MGGQTYKHVMQAERQMFARQCLFVWPGLNCEMFEMTWQVITLKAVLH